MDVYSLPYDPQIPVICMDEKPYQLLDEKLAPIPMTPGQVKKIDHEYVRTGTCSIFIFTEPLAGWRNTSVRVRRTSQDWAQEIHELLTVHYPDKAKIRIVMDNLSTHTLGALYQTYSPEIARNLASRLEVHYTPKHGSWLNVAEIELSVMERQCLKRRLPDIDTLRAELSTWHTDRNKNQKPVDWQFTNKDARTKLKRLYPVVN